MGLGSEGAGVGRGIHPNEDKLLGLLRAMNSVCHSIYSKKD